jgi:hypothetical protein
MLITANATTKKCQVVSKSKDRGPLRCLKPAEVLLHNNTPAMLHLCRDCARRLVVEILDSTPGGRLDRREINKPPQIAGAR